MNTYMFIQRHACKKVELIRMKNCSNLETKNIRSIQEIFITNLHPSLCQALFSYQLGDEICRQIIVEPFEK